MRTSPLCSRLALTLFAILALSLPTVASAQNTTPAPATSAPAPIAATPASPRPMMAAEVVPSGALNVRTFGAVGNGQAKDTAAFQKALDAARDAGGGIVWVPTGSYLIGSITVGSNTTLQFSRSAMLTGSPDIADYPLGAVRYEGEYVSGHRALISATNASNVTLTGPGWIFGPPASLSRLRSPRGPVLLEFTSCANVTLDGFTAQYQMLWTIHPLLCTNFTARNLIIRSVGANSDGIDVDSCSGVLIDHCNIDTGDDAIALKSGRGQAAVTLARPTENVEITHCALLSSIFGALAIGSEISGGIRHVHVADCVLSGHQNSIFIKSRDGRAGFIDDINGENLTVYNSPTFVCFNLTGSGIQATDPVPGEVAQWTRATNIRFSNVELINITDPVIVRPLKGLDGIPAALPADGFSLTNIHGTTTHGLTLTNMANVTISNLALTGYTPPLFTLRNVQGSGLEEAK